MTNRLLGYIGEEEEGAEVFQRSPDGCLKGEGLHLVPQSLCLTIALKRFACVCVCVCVCVCEGDRIITGLSPQQHVARVAGGDPFEGVHFELVEVVGGVLGMNVGSETDRHVGEN